MLMFFIFYHESHKFSQIQFGNRSCLFSILRICHCECNFYHKDHKEFHNAHEAASIRLVPSYEVHKVVRHSLVSLVGQLVVRCGQYLTCCLVSFVKFFAPFVVKAVFIIGQYPLLKRSIHNPPFILFILNNQGGTVSTSAIAIYGCNI